MSRVLLSSVGAIIGRSHFKSIPRQLLPQSQLPKAHPCPMLVLHTSPGQGHWVKGGLLIIPAIAVIGFPVRQCQTPVLLGPLILVVQGSNFGRHRLRLHKEAEEEVGRAGSRALAQPPSSPHHSCSDWMGSQLPANPRLVCLTQSELLRKVHHASVLGAGVDLPFPDLV
ncbi:uncharacterized protein BJX67DRAFT_152787 [Aspergillus lucknowensis]|uniref:Uncharacterized protein n=1 Tax=Aspergillus lucknowensis TaxID=176173 RepID=A0ABR4LRL7_9EURO